MDSTVDSQRSTVLDSSVLFDSATRSYIFQCCWCTIPIVVREGDLACKIFRCGAYKENGAPIPPHMDQASCERIFRANIIDGCAKPFEFKTAPDGTHYISRCGYI